MRRKQGEVRCRKWAQAGAAEDSTGTEAPRDGRAGQERARFSRGRRLGRARPAEGSMMRAATGQRKRSPAEPERASEPARSTCPSSRLEAGRWPLAAGPSGRRASSAAAFNSPVREPSPQTPSHRPGPVLDPRKRAVSRSAGLCGRPGQRQDRHASWAVWQPAASSQASQAEAS